MIKTDFRYQKAFNNWQASRFEGKKSIYVDIDLVPCRTKESVQEWLSKDIIDQTARRLRNKINQDVYGNAARRFGKGLTMVVHLHEAPHKHLHCVIELPEHIMLLKFKSIIDNVCFEDSWLKQPRYLSETKDHIAAQHYNGRFGPDTVILF